MSKVWFIVLACAAGIAGILLVVATGGAHTAFTEPTQATATQQDAGFVECGPRISGHKWVKLTHASKVACVRTTLDMLSGEGTLSAQETQPCEFYVDGLDEVFAVSSNRDSLVLTEVTGFISVTDTGPSAGETSSQSSSGTSTTAEYESSARSLLDTHELITSRLTEVARTSTDLRKSGSEADGFALLDMGVRNYVECLEEIVEAWDGLAPPIQYQAGHAAHSRSLHEVLAAYIALADCAERQDASCVSTSAGRAAQATNSLMDSLILLYSEGL